MVSSYGKFQLVAKAKAAFNKGSTAVAQTVSGSDVKPIFQTTTESSGGLFSKVKDTIAQGLQVMPVPAEAQQGIDTSVPVKQSYDWRPVGYAAAAVAAIALLASAAKKRR